MKPGVFLLAMFIAIAKGDEKKVGLNPQNLNSSYLLSEPNTNRTLSFRIKGNYFAGLDYAHIYATFNVDVAVTYYNAINRHLDESQSKLNKLFNDSKKVEHTNRFFTSLRRELIEIHSDLLFICMATNCEVSVRQSKFPLPYFQHRQQSLNNSLTNHTKHKRSAELILGAFSLGLSIYDLTEIKTLQSQLEGLNKADNLIASQLKENTNALRRLSEFTTELGLNLNKLESDLTTIEYKQGLMETIFLMQATQRLISEWTSSVINILINKKINPRLFNSRDLKNALLEIKQKAKTKDYILMSTLLTDVINEEVSFIADNGTLTFIIHIPLGRQPLLTMYELIPSPLLLSDNRVVRLTTNKDLIAINNPTTEKVELRFGDLRNCVIRKKSYVCTGGITHKNIGDSCLGSMFMGDNKKLLELCEFEEIPNDSEVISQVGSNKLIIYSSLKSKTTMFIACPGEIPSQVVIDGYKEITIKPECVATTENYVFKPEQKLHIHKYFVTQQLTDFDFSFNDLFIFKRNFTKFSPIKLGVWNNAIDKQLELNSHFGHSGTLILIIIIIALIIVLSLCVLAALLYCRYRAKANQPVQREPRLPEREEMLPRSSHDPDSTEEGVLLQPRRHSGRHRDDSGSETLARSTRGAAASPDGASSTELMSGNLPPEPRPRFKFDGQAVK